MKNSKYSPSVFIMTEWKYCYFFGFFIQKFIWVFQPFIMCVLRAFSYTIHTYTSFSEAILFFVRSVLAWSVSVGWSACWKNPIKRMKICFKTKINFLLNWKYLLYWWYFFFIYTFLLYCILFERLDYLFCCSHRLVYRAIIQAIKQNYMVRFWFYVPL